MKVRFGLGMDGNRSRARESNPLPLAFADLFLELTVEVGERAHGGPEDGAGLDALDP